MRPSLRLATALTLVATALGGMRAMADEQRYNQIALNAKVSQDVAHDLMNVTLYSEDQDSDPAKLAARITTTLNAAIERARKAEGVKVSQGSRNSYPIYDDKGQRISGWRERAELRLESADFASLSQLTAELLQQMKMGGMNFEVSDPARKQTEDALIKDAVAAFKARAQLTTEALGGSGYRLVSLNLNSSGFEPPIRMRMMAMKAMGGADAAPSPEIEAGTSQVSVNADGIIEVQMP
ncbi:SIMPL domain-containing protein [Pseudomonas sp. RIT-PI-AD]|uniref:SIMPL domain-containing protein n=1 Tax=Pseudomonas sp. RIT-PI-AD TaxID=3035294 RepID=UPI0021D95BFB|nr:SIMPL domain-containing protein [Pseudomonas sp. RIT-PI-AD]